MTAKCQSHQKLYLTIDEFEQLQIGGIRTHMHHYNNTQEKTLKIRKTEAD